MTDRPTTDEFFIGWLPVPPGYRRFLGPVVGGLLLGITTLVVLVARSQNHAGTGQWDTAPQTFQGVIVARPYPMLRVAGAGPDDPPRTFLLVEEGKFGAGPRVEQLLGGGPAERAARATGAVLHRDGRWMLELAEGDSGLQLLPVDRAMTALAWPQAQVIAERVMLQGEIIDPKCYLGAMKPGGGKTHKTCATLCVAGGIPPMLVTRTAHGTETYYLLTSPEGGPANAIVLAFVGDPVAVVGRLEQQGDLLLLRVNAADIARR